MLVVNQKHYLILLAGILLGKIHAHSPFEDIDKLPLVRIGINGITPCVMAKFEFGF